MRTQGKRVWIVGQFIAIQMEIEDGVIGYIHGYGAGPADQDYGDKRTVPGFINIHTHEAYDFDTNDSRSEGLRNWMKRIPEEDVTAILPTTVTQMPDVLAKAVVNMAAVVKEGYEGVEILGIRFEGPFLSMEYKGAQPPEAIASASAEQFKKYQEAAQGFIRYITLAPERDSDHVLTRYCSTHGAMISMGHSAATYEQALLGIANGATSMIHVYNGMTPYHHRKPGLVGTAFQVRDIYGKITCDDCHSHLAALNNFLTAKGRDYSIMISDSLRAKYCLPGGECQLGGHNIEIGEDGLARLKGADTIAGSTLNMNRGLKILVEQALVPFDTVLGSCTISPARCLGVDHRKGKIATERNTDLVILDGDYGVLQTWCRGCAML